jgi:hypothetical protein
VKSVPVWLKYTVLRVLLFAVPFTVLMLAGVTWWISALVAALFGLAASAVFLRTSRDEMSRNLYAARHREAPAPTVDADAEDAAIDARNRPAGESALRERPSSAPAD